MSTSLSSSIVPNQLSIHSYQLFDINNKENQPTNKLQSETSDSTNSVTQKTKKRTITPPSHSIKRFKASDLFFNDLSPEMQVLIFSFLKLKDLNHTHSVSKGFNQLSCHAAYWKNLSKESDEKLNKNWHQTFLSAVEAEHPKALFIKAIRVTKKTEVKSQLIKKILGMQLENELKDRVTLYDKCLDFQTFHLSSRTESKKCKIKKLNRFLFNTSQNPKTLPQDKSHADLYQALIGCQILTSRLKDDEIINLFLSVINSPHSLLEDKARAKLYLATNRYGLQVPKLTNSKAAKILHDVSKDVDASLEDKARAQLCYAIMHYENQITELTDDALAELLLNMSQDPNAFEEDRAEAKLYYALMIFYGRYTASDDESAAQLLKNVKRNENASNDDRIRAKLYLALFRYEERTYSLTDEEAVNLLQDVIKNQEESFCILESKTLAKLYLAFMQLEGRPAGLARSLNQTEQAIKLLEDILKDPNANEWAKEEAKKSLESHQH